MGGEGNPRLFKEVAHQWLCGDIVEGRVAIGHHEVTCHEFVSAVLPIAADGQGRLDVGALVDGLGVGRPDNAHARAEILVAVVVPVDVALRAFLVGNEDVHAAVAAKSPKGKGASPSCRDMEFEGTVLVLGHGTGANVDAKLGEDDRRGVTVVDQKAGTLVPVERSFCQHFRAQEAQLAAAVPLVLVAVAQAQVEHRSSAVPKLCGEGCREKIGIGEGFVVDDGHRSTPCSWHREVVGVGQVDTLHAPQHPAGAVATHHDVVSGIVRALDAGKVAGHARGISSRPRITVRLFHCEGPGTDGRHVVHDLPCLRCRDLCGLDGHHTFLKVHVEHHRPATRDHHPLKHARLVAHEGHLEGMSPQRHLVQLKAPVQICGRHHALHCEQLHRGPHQRVAGFSVDDAARNGGGGNLGHRSPTHETKHPCQCNGFCAFFEVVHAPNIEKRDAYAPWSGARLSTWPSPRDGQRRT